MRASKEQADKAKQRLTFIQEKVKHNNRQVRIAFEEVEEFINSAKRRLPTEAAIERDRNRKR